MIKYEGIDAAVGGSTGIGISLFKLLRMNWRIVLLGVMLLSVVSWVADKYFEVDYKLTLFIGLSTMILSVICEGVVTSNKIE